MCSNVYDCHYFVATVVLYVLPCKAFNMLGHDIAMCAFIPLSEIYFVGFTLDLLVRAGVILAFIGPTAILKCPSPFLTEIISGNMLGTSPSPVISPRFSFHIFDTVLYWSIRSVRDLISM